MTERPVGGGNHSLAERLGVLPTRRLASVLDGLPDWACAQLLYDWSFWARPKQIPPDGNWFCWLILAGRGFGKTRTGAEWVRMLVEGSTPMTAPPGRTSDPEGSDALRVAIVAETAHDGRSVMIEGESGLLATAPPDRRPHYEPSKRRLTWPNGAEATVYSAEDPDQLRGPQHHIAWCDELAKWRYPEDVWANLTLGLRLGAQPRICVTTTPRPLPFLKTLLKDPSTVTTRGSTFENSGNLPKTFIDQVTGLYAGTRLGRQELEAEILEDVPGALWSRDALEQLRRRAAPEMARMVVAVDPPVTSGPGADACGIVVAGAGLDGAVYVLEDLSAVGLSPNQWATRAIEAYHRWDADRLVAEVNNGGELVAAVVRQIDGSVSYRDVRASRGKVTRAEPVAALYERGLVHHVGALPALEDEMCAFMAGTDGRVGGHSPDRVDALVWAIHELVLRRADPPRVRTMG